jgi:diguanylate cyclase (GGDEF)-like protein
VLGQIKFLLSLNFILPSAVLTALFITLFLRGKRRMRLEVYTDSLMPIRNRRYINTFFPGIVKQHYTTNSPLSVVMVDVDHFKQYNDNYGHQEGDQVLIMVSKAINSVLRKEDVVCRYGGEELFVILKNSGPPEAKAVAERIQEAINDMAIKHEYSTISDVVTVSQGIYSAVPDKVDSDKEFIRVADKLLYEAKNSGRNQYIMAKGYCPEIA